MFCIHCGSKIVDGAKFCGNCGSALPAAEPAPREVPVEEEIRQALNEQLYPADAAPQLTPAFDRRNTEAGYEDAGYEEYADEYDDAYDEDAPDAYDDAYYADDDYEDADDYAKKKRVLIPVLIACIVVLAAVLAAVYLFILAPRFDLPTFIKNKTVAEEETTTETQAETEAETTTEPTTQEQKETQEAVQFPKTMYVTVQSDGLLLREGPGTNYQALLKMENGTAVTVQKIENNWAYGTCAGYTGWCSCDYLTEKKSSSGGSSSSSGTQAFDPNKLVEPANRTEYGYHGTVNTSDGLLFRYGPGQNYTAFDVIPYGTTVAEEGWDGNWIYIQYNGRYGWVNADYVTASGGMAKPAIYLYPETAQEIYVDVQLTEGAFTFTAPAYQNGWHVWAEPSGTLTDLADGKSFAYIFWESNSEPTYDWSQGYTVAGKKTEDFLRKLLPQMGLNEKEAKEYIAYWVPRMYKNTYNYITFQTTCYTDAAKLAVSPQPDSLLRLFMAYRAVDAPIDAPAPQITGFTRSGFTVVEWGGAEVQ